VNGRHFCGVHKLTFQDNPGALKEGRIFDCETDVVVCSKVHGMGLAYSFFLSGFLAGKKIERVQLRLPSANKKIASLVDAFRGALGGENQRPRTCAETI
jgi:hypothetical protein